jgi:hypothetical protein
MRLNQCVHIHITSHHITTPLSSRRRRVLVLHEHPDREVEPTPVSGLQNGSHPTQGQAHLDQPVQDVDRIRAQITQDAGLVVQNGQVEGRPMPRRRMIMLRRRRGRGGGRFQRDPILDPTEELEGLAEEAIAPSIDVPSQQRGQDGQAGFEE